MIHHLPLQSWYRHPLLIRLQTGGHSDVTMTATRSFFLLAAAWVDPGRSALQSAEQWCQGRYGRIHQVGKMSFSDKNMQKGRLKQHAKRGGNKKPSTASTKTAKEGSGDVKKTTPMPERIQQHRKTMALVKPKGSTYARASMQVTRRWRKQRGSFHCWPLIEYFV